MRWLHISDIHFNMKGYDSKIVQEQLLIKLQELNIKMDFILITGDCLFKFGGESWDQKSVVKYIKQLANVCQCSYKRVYICPGNHDIDRYNNFRNNLIDEIREDEKDFSENFQILCGYGHDRFEIIYKGVTANNYEVYKVFEPRKEIYRIISIDSCLISKDKEDCQKLKIFNEKIYEIGKKIKNDKKLNILIMHHGIECLDLADARKFEHWIEDNNIDLVFCGHTHRAAVNSYDDLIRDVKQFTAGAIVVDNYAIPSFYICEYSEVKTQVDMLLYTFSLEIEKWALDNQLLRKFCNGKYVYNLSRHKNLIIKNKEKSVLKINKNDESNVLESSNPPEITKSDSIQIEFDASQLLDINSLQFSDVGISQFFEVKYISRYLNKFGSDKIYSNRYSGYEKFDSWKIIESLVDIGINYSKALEMTYLVIKKITSDEFQSKQGILSCEELKNVVYDILTHYPISKEENEYEVSCWASRYARKYNRDKEILVINKFKEKSKLNYDYIRNTLLRCVIDSVTNNKIFYEKIIHNELTRMSESVLDFLKKMGIFEVREEALFELIKEYITQSPHPWLVNNNRSMLTKYHKEHGIIHIRNLKGGYNKQTIITQMEAAYHICAAFLVQYDDYIGCTEISPIIILASALNNVTNKGQNNTILPMQKFQIIQLKKDLKYRGIKFEIFKRDINILKRNIVVAQKISLRETKDTLIELWDILEKLEKPVVKTSISEKNIERVRDIFDGASGFIVKSNLRDLTNCFWVEPNWEEYEILQQHLGKQILVCVLENIDNDVEKIYQYLYVQNKRDISTEIVFVLNDYSTFDSETRKKIRNVFKRKYLRCIFVQEDNFAQISKERGWREIFYKILEISKIS